MSTERILDFIVKSEESGKAWDIRQKPVYPLFGDEWSLEVYGVAAEKVEKSIVWGEEKLLFVLKGVHREDGEYDADNDLEGQVEMYMHKAEFIRSVCGKIIKNKKK